MKDAYRVNIEAEEFHTTAAVANLVSEEGIRSLGALSKLVENDRIFLRRKGVGQVALTEARQLLIRVREYVRTRPTPTDMEDIEEDEDDYDEETTKAAAQALDTILGALSDLTDDGRIRVLRATAAYYAIDL